MVVAESAVVDGQFIFIYSRGHRQRIDVRIHSHAAAVCRALVAEGDAGEGYRLSVGSDVQQILCLRLRRVLHDDGGLAEVLYLLAVGGASRATAHYLERRDELLPLAVVVHDEREGIVAGVCGGEVFAVTHVHLSVGIYVGGGGVARRVRHRHDSAAQVGALVVPTAAVARAPLLGADVHGIEVGELKDVLKLV